jgi:hypothetical protein
MPINFVDWKVLHSTIGRPPLDKVGGIGLDNERSFF